MLSSMRTELIRPIQALALLQAEGADGRTLDLLRDIFLPNASTHGRVKVGQQPRTRSGAFARPSPDVAGKRHAAQDGLAE